MKKLFLFILCAGLLWTSKINAQGGANCSSAVIITPGQSYRAMCPSSGVEQWYQFQAVAGAWYKASNCGDAGDTEVYIYDNCSSNYLVFGQDNCGARSEVVFQTPTAGTYYIRWKFWETGTGNINWSFERLSDLIAGGASCSQATAISSTGGTYTAVHLAATSEQWYKFPAQPGLYTITNCGATTQRDTKLEIYDACNGNLVVANDNGCGLLSTATIQIANAGTYYIRWTVKDNGYDDGGYYDWTLSQQEENNVTITTSLSDALSGKNLAGITNLKIVSGELDANDFSFIRNNLPFLQILDMGNATVEGNSIPDRAFYPFQSLSSVVIPTTVTKIGSWAFGSCQSLSSVTIPASVTEIGDYAFYLCNNLADITIPAAVTSIGTGIFRDCTSLRKILVSDENKNYSSSDGVLFNLDKTDLIQYPPGKTDNSYTIPASVKNIGTTAFASCYNLTVISFPASITSIGNNIFSGCRNLTTISVAGENNVYSSIDGILFSKDQTEIVAYPPGKPGNTYVIPDFVSKIGNYAFLSCSGLTVMNIPGTVTSIGDEAFSSCTYLTSLNISEGVKSIGRSAFSNCYSLTSMTIPQTVTNIESAPFYYCRNLTSVDVLATVTDLSSFFFDYCNKLISVRIPKTVTTINACAFRNCSSLSAIYLYNPQPATLDGSEIFLNVDKANCSLFVPAGSVAAYRAAEQWGDFTNIVELDADGMLTVDVTGTTLQAAITAKGITNPAGITHLKVIGNELKPADFAYMKSNLISLQILDMSGAKIENNRLAGRLYQFNSLISVIVPASVMDLGSLCFIYCNKLTVIHVDAASPYYTSIDGIVFSKDGKTLVEYPVDKPGINYVIPASVTNIGDFALANNKQLVSVTVPATVTSIGDESFVWGRALTAINVAAENTNYSSIDGVLFSKDQTEIIAYPAGKPEESYAIPQSVTTIINDAFNACRNLVSIDIPESVTDIENFAFSSCDKLVSIQIPSSVKTIGYSAFSVCTSLASMYVYSEVPISLNEVVFEYTDQSKCTLYVPSGSVSAYRAAEQWGDFTNIVELDADGMLTVDVTGTTLQAAIEAKGITDPAGIIRLKVIGNELKYADFTYMRSNLTSLQVLDMSGANIENNRLISHFYQYNSLISVTIPASVTTIASPCFIDCNKLTAIHVDAASPYYTSIDGIVFSKDGKTLITYPVDKPGNNYVIPASVTNIGDFAFANNKQLGSVTVPATVTSIGYESFGVGHALTAINVDGENINYSSIDGVLFSKDQTEIIAYPVGNPEVSYTIPQSVTTIINSAFGVCRNLVSIDIPGSVTDIENFAFSGCEGLVSIQIPSSVKTIGYSAFSECTSLTSMYVYSEVPISLDENVFEYTDQSKCTLYVPASSISAYRAADQWGDFVNIMAIEPVTGINLKDAVTIKVGEFEMLEATIIPEGAAVNQAIRWTTSDASVATVDASGKVTGVKIGTADITATSVDNPDISTVCRVTVKATSAAVTGVTLDKEVLTLVIDESQTLIATVLPDDADNKAVEWRSTNIAIATVDATGMVTGVEAGMVLVIATTVDGGRKDTCTVKVTEAALETGTAVIEGTITNIPTGTTIYLYRDESTIKSTLPENYALVAITVADAEGRYKFENLPAGTYKVMVNITGYESEPSADITLPEGGKTSGINFKVNSANHTVTPEAVTGIKIAEKPLATLYPNPTDGPLTLSFDAPGTYRVTMTNISGRILLRQVINDQVGQMDISSYPAGVYLLVIDNGKQQSVIKIVRK